MWTLMSPFLLGCHFFLLFLIITGFYWEHAQYVENFAPACRLLQRAVGKESLQEVIDVHGTIPYLDMHYKSAHLCVDHEKTREICKQFPIRYLWILVEPNSVHDIFTIIIIWSVQHMGLIFDCCGTVISVDRFKRPFNRLKDLFCI